MTFADATAVTENGDHYLSEIHDGWDVAGNANGGYLMALGARAMSSAAGRDHPVALNAHFLAPGRTGPVTVHPRVVREGGRFTTVSASLRAGDRHLVELRGRFVSLERVAGPVRAAATPPELPPPEDCLQMTPERGSPSLMGKVDLRLHPEDAGFARGEPTGRPLFRGWLRFHGEEVDAFGLILAADVFPPTVFNANLPIAWAPTLEMTAHVRGQPEPGWLRCRFSTRFITGGLMEEDGEIWDASGRLVAQSRQLALVPRPRT
ncbi:MAG: thioesterase family protein [Acidobacteriota bacterium]